MREKILRWLHAIVNLIAVAPLIAGSISPTKAVTIIAVSTAVKEIILTLGDLIDDWQLNKSFSAIALGFLVLSSTGCMGGAAMIRAAGKDPSAATLQIRTIYGTVLYSRGGASTNAVEVTEAGAIKQNQ